MGKMGMPEPKKSVRAWYSEKDDDAYRHMLMQEKKKKEIDTTSEIRRRDKPDDLDILGLGR